MAITFALVSATPNQLRYLVAHDGLAGNVGALPNTAAAGSPNFRNDAALPPLNAVPLASIDGYPPAVAGVLTAGQIRALLLSDFITAPAIVQANLLIGRCKAFLTPRTGANVMMWVVDAIADAASPIGFTNPTYQVTAVFGAAGAAAGTCYLDIVFQNTPDR
ncbi:hypothetical protein LCGC14_1144710 [marine sediment metagenome]|uniref:Uncharacterized protein n=1 Tax=marine sediment metagenome TaxID=412755 RepID=A0A0F9MKF8_9ZZZZ